MLRFLRLHGFAKHAARFGLRGLGVQAQLSARRVDHVTSEKQHVFGRRGRWIALDLNLADDFERLAREIATHAELVEDLELLRSGVACECRRPGQGVAIALRDAPAARQ